MTFKLNIEIIKNDLSNDDFYSKYKLIVSDIKHTDI